METTKQQLDAMRQADSVTALKEMMRGDVGADAREYVWRQESLYFSELLEGQVRSENRFTLSCGRIICHDSNGREIDWLEMADNGVLYAKVRAHDNPELIPYIEIAEAEKNECLLQQELISQPVPRTLVNYSLCGDDLLSPEALLSLGRLPAKKRGFVRVSVFDGQGNMEVLSRSIDGLSMSAVAASYAKFGITLRPDCDTAEVLRSPVILNYADYGLADVLAPKQGIDTFEFIIAQQDLLRAHVDGLAEIARRYGDISTCAQLSEDLRYDIVSSLKHRMLGRWNNSGSLTSDIAAAGIIEREAGTQYYGCDTLLGNQPIGERLGYMALGQEKTECVGCRKCGKTVNLPVKLFSKGYLHCVECKATFSKHTNRYLNGRETAALLGNDKSPTQGKIVQTGETLGQWIHRIGQEVKRRNRQKKLMRQEQAGTQKRTAA